MSFLLLTYNNIFSLSSPVPAAVKALHLTFKDTTELVFGWNVSEGKVDSYDLRLYTQETTPVHLEKHKMVGENETSCAFPHLLPGELYKLVVISRRKGMSSESSLLGRTGETHYIW